MPYTFTTFVGPNADAVDGIGSRAQFVSPFGIVADDLGNLWVTDVGRSTIRRITAAGLVTTLAGTNGGPGSQDGTGSAAWFYYPSGIALDAGGNLLVTDRVNGTIRRITPNGVVTTFAGVVGEYGSNDGVGTAARFNYDDGIAVDRAGNVYVADTNNHLIRRITAAGVVTTLAGRVGDIGSADGPGAVARFSQPGGIAVDADGVLYVADTANCTIRKIAPDGVVSTLAGTPTISGTTDGVGSAARFNRPTGIAVDAAGRLFVADLLNSTIRQITPAGVVTTLAGVAATPGYADGAAARALFLTPSGVTLDRAGNIFVADTGNRLIRKISPTGAVSTLAGTPGGGVVAPAFQNQGLAVDNAGTVYAVSVDGGSVLKISPLGAVTVWVGSSARGLLDGVGSAARFRFPQGIAVDQQRNGYIADTNNNVIRKITPAGVVTTLAGGDALSPGSTDGKGDLARFNGPYAIAVDSAGVVFVADTLNSTIRRVTPDGLVTTLAGRALTPGSTDGMGANARFFRPFGLAVDGAGNVYVADSFNNTVRKITTAGMVTTFAGQFFNPLGIAADAAGNVFVADTNNKLIRHITPAGGVTTIAGLAPGGTVNGTGIGARFDLPEGIAVDRAGNLYVLDNGVIRFGAARGDTPDGLYIATEPAGQTVPLGSPVAFSATILSARSSTYQWYFNGAPIPGASKSSLTIDATAEKDAGTYTMVATTSTGSVTSAPAPLWMVNSAPSRLVNLSGRATVSDVGRPLVVGFTVNAPPGATRPLLVRAAGPALEAFDARPALTRPVLAVRDAAGRLLATNTGWSTSANAALITSFASSVGAFAWASGSADSAILASLAPGTYTAQITSAGGTPGTALAELYEVDHTGGATLGSLGAFGYVDATGEPLSAGLVVAGGPATVLIRGEGPALTQFGVGDVVARPVLTVRNATDSVVATNARWTTNPNLRQIATTAASVGLFPLTVGGADTALLLVLSSGLYTVQLASSGLAGGNAMIEIYRVDP